MAEVNQRFAVCRKCGVILPPWTLNTRGITACPNCGVHSYALVFPALFRDVEKGRDGDALLVDAEASCFYHPGKKATLVCEGCGRFLCALCDVMLVDRHLCPACIEAGKRKDRIRNLRNERVLYDDIALSVAVIPMLMFFVTFITAPIALFMTIRYWNRPTSILPRTKVRFVLAAIFALIQLGGWGVFVVSVARSLV